VCAARNESFSALGGSGTSAVAGVLGSSAVVSFGAIFDQDDGRLGAAPVEVRLKKKTSGDEGYEGVPLSLRTPTIYCYHLPLQIAVLSVVFFLLLLCSTRKTFKTTGGLGGFTGLPSYIISAKCDKAFDVVIPVQVRISFDTNTKLRSGLQGPIHKRSLTDRTRFLLLAQNHQGQGL
jgi:hypothetical protein